MNNKARYKYFNLIIRSIIGIAALLFIYFKLKDSYYYQLNELDTTSINFLFIVITFLLSFFNWGLESLKWKYLISKIKEVTFIQAYKIILTGIAMSLVTPNRVGEIPVRAYLLNDKENLSKLTYATFIGSFTQLLATIFFGTVGVFYTITWFDFYLSNSILITLIIFTLLLLLLFMFSNKIKDKILNLFNKQSSIDFSRSELTKTLIFSILRYMIFVLQYYFLLEAFGIHFTSLVSFWLIPLCFFVASSIPTFLISEIGVRSSVAIIVFGVLSNNDVAIIASSVTLWTINIAIPAIFGIGFIKQLKISR
ncbi:MAG: flippase-like domain-containing protein [Flavobacteriales bacterium]